MDNKDKFKLVTRRYLALGFGGFIVLTLCFVVIWSQVTHSTCSTCGGNPLADVALGGLIGALVAIIGFYFKKVSEE